MSRIGKKPIAIPTGVTLTYAQRHLRVQGEKGQLERDIHPEVELDIGDAQMCVLAKSPDKKHRALQGLTRSLLDNMITGVSRGFTRVLEIHGIGYRANMEGKTIVFNLGFSNPVNFALPDGVDAVVDKNNVITLSGIDKELLGHTAAAIRRLRPPEPYKGKGIKFAEERIQRKAGKTGTK